MEEAPRSPSLKGLLCVALALVGCAGRDPSAPPPAARLLVGAPASARALFEAAIKIHVAREHSVDPPSLTAASADELAKSGVPFDVLAVEEVAGLGLLPPLVSERAWARDPVVVLARKAALDGGAQPTLARLPELASIKKVALADSRGADGAGAAAEAVLGAAGVRHKLAARLAYFGTAAQVRSEIAAGRVDVALLRASDLGGLDAAASGLVVLERVDPPRPRHTIGVVGASPRKDEARRFLDIVTSEEVAAQLASLGLERPLPPAR
jgi:ABC-type molybdate transport system substrate-binding protein